MKRVMTSFIYPVLLGILQGLTEFLPVSSSGHLVLAQSLIPGFSQPGVLFDVILHFGTLLAILIFFAKQIFRISVRYILLIIVGTIPAVIAGYFLQDSIAKIFSSTTLVGVALIITGLVNLLTSLSPRRNRKLNFKNSLLIGLAQAFAIIPGISRSGSTIFTAIKSGLSPKKAARYSFLLSVPAVFGANVLEIYKYIKQPSFEAVTRGMWGYYALGFIAALISGVGAIGVVIRLLEKNKFRWFFYYCVIMGIAALIF